MIKQTFNLFLKTDYICRINNYDRIKNIHLTSFQNIDIIYKKKNMFVCTCVITLKMTTEHFIGKRKKCKPIITDDDNPVRGTKPIVFAELRK